MGFVVRKLVGPCFWHTLVVHQEWNYAPHNTQTLFTRPRIVDLGLTDVPGRTPFLEAVANSAAHTLANVVDVVRAALGVDDWADIPAVCEAAARAVSNDIIWLHLQVGKRLCPQARRKAGLSQQQNMLCCGANQVVANHLHAAAGA
jgi:hypothetical protein